MNNLELNWKTNTLKRRKTIQKLCTCKKRIYDQLTSEHGEKFTDDEAQYAIDNMKADFNENALKKAKSYQESMNMPPGTIRD